jgi:hypothetical protein
MAELIPQPFGKDFFQIVAVPMIMEPSKENCGVCTHEKINVCYNEHMAFEKISST